MSATDNRFIFFTCAGMFTGPWRNLHIRMLNSPVHQCRYPGRIVWLQGCRTERARLSRCITAVDRGTTLREGVFKRRLLSLTFVFEKTKSQCSMIVKAYHKVPPEVRPGVAPHHNHCIRDQTMPWFHILSTGLAPNDPMGGGGSRRHGVSHNKKGHLSILFPLSNRH